MPRSRSKKNDVSLKLIKMAYRRWSVWGMIFFFVLSAGIGSYSYWWYSQTSFLHIFHPPVEFTRRTDDFTANIGGMLSAPPLPNRLIRRMTKGVWYQLNNGSWHQTDQNSPRVPSPTFTVELDNKELLSGTNSLVIKAILYGHTPELDTLQFNYNATLPQLPINVNWENTNLVSDDGYWEKFELDGEWRVRPKPGYEGYNRILVVSGAFPQGRQMKTDVIYRGRLAYADEFGFGILSLWGGRPDDSVPLRGGWRYGLAWYWSRSEGMGNEFSTKYGNQTPQWVNSYRNLDLVPDVRYSILVESWPEQDAMGHHLCYRQRMKWWPSTEEEPTTWLELADTEGCLLPLGEYGVALVAYHAKVDFGPVKIRPLYASGVNDSIKTEPQVKIPNTSPVHFLIDTNAIPRT